MAKHTWLCNLRKPTLEKGSHYLKKAIQEGLSFDLAICFAGYALESKYQAGGSNHWNQWFLENQDSVDSFLQAAIRCNHRYSKGKNAENYRLVGQRIVEHMIMTTKYE